jgi:hypothetical protein
LTRYPTTESSVTVQEASPVVGADPVDPTPEADGDAEVEPSTSGGGASSWIRWM